MLKFNSSQLRTSPVDENIKKSIRKNPIYIICDNVLDTYNVGAIFRLADAVAAEKVFLCAGTETPPNPKIKKASVNTWDWVEWEYCETAILAISKIKMLNCHPESDSDRMKDPVGIKSARDSSRSLRMTSKIMVVSIEQNKKSVPLKDFKPEFPIALVVGNETYGVSKEVLDISDEIVELPMYGINTSLNVMVTLGIVLYRVIEFL
ncbi:hypothetical protein A3D77_01040 [Candidatus Gottesmanbacteria bacterium RIFCSPHIGHO2_02_FULL_39_11]|uniref:tRNA/rRNA methyltransferase SpoU type domain-containing protein n=1 Tax=Candidatus Gottesmanbacteria bacterium RIFCSPHIGHO2_02_FULL_39_11 TaxID=1798382 RepID=A0A1F5ZW84_9BACT|nr:MAG: hypothetical protein A3D77_01040 [Candidatus Gottesmanbacteria bacterium RIFCSPHIGHO2_02_FULL_39_11]